MSAIVCEIKPDAPQMLKLRKFLEAMPSALAKAVDESMNEAIKAGREVAAQDLSREMTASKSSVMRRLSLKKADAYNPGAALIIRGGRGVNLAGFSPEPSKPNKKGGGRPTDGVSVREFGHRQVYARSFVVIGLHGNKLVAVDDLSRGKVTPAAGTYEPGGPYYAGRKTVPGPGHARQTIKRRHIKSLYGKTVAETWVNTPGIEGRTTSAVVNALDSAVDKQIDKALRN